MASIPKTNRVTHIVVWGTSLIVLILAIYAVRTLTSQKVTVRVAPVTYQDMESLRKTTGKVEPVNDFQAHAPVAGQIEDIYVDVGDKVKAGSLLLKMDDQYALANLAHAQSTLQAARLATSDIEHGGTQDERNTYASDLSKAKLQRQQDGDSLAALQKLQQQGASSAGEVAAAQHRVQADDDTIHSIEQHSTQRYGQADLARAQAELADANAAVAAAKSSYANADIHTPISGTVYYLPVSQYDYVEAGEDLIYVADLTHLRVTAYFDEPEIGDLATGQPVKITWEARQGTIWHGHIVQVPTTIITYGTRNVGQCFITVDDADGVLQPNANVIVTVTTARHPHVLTIPREALRFDGPQAYVFRVLNHKLTRTPIQTGIVNLTQVEVTSGLADGDIVALNATTNRDLTNGLVVESVQ
jgi:HlyD family secretion protein